MNAILTFILLGGIICLFGTDAYPQINFRLQSKLTAQSDSLYSDSVHRICSEPCSTNTNQAVIACKLTNSQFHTRKRGILAKVNKAVRKRDELTLGYKYTFPASDAMLDVIVNLIKLERTCCGFLEFVLTINKSKSELQLEIVGPVGAKEFIQEELGL